MKLRQEADTCLQHSARDGTEGPNHLAPHLHICFGSDAGLCGRPPRCRHCRRRWRCCGRAAYPTAAVAAAIVCATVAADVSCASWVPGQHGVEEQNEAFIQLQTLQQLAALEPAPTVGRRGGWGGGWVIAGEWAIRESRSARVPTTPACRTLKQAHNFLLLVNTTCLHDPDSKTTPGACPPSAASRTSTTTSGSTHTLNSCDGRGRAGRRCRPGSTG